MKEEKPLQGKTYNVSMMYLRNNIGKIITSIEMGATYILHKKGKAVAALQGLPGETLTINISKEGEISYLQTGYGLSKSEGKKKSDESN